MSISQFLTRNMSSLGIVDFIARNLLDEVGATPVWEKFRKHLYAVGVGISLLVLYFNREIHVECAPAYSNGTVMKTDLYSRHINKYCANSGQLSAFRYSGFILIVMDAIILLAASYWLYIPNVIKPLRIFSKIRGLVSDIHLPWEEMKRLMTTPMKKAEFLKTPTNPTDSILKQKIMREVITLLPSFKEGMNLTKDTASSTQQYRRKMDNKDDFCYCGTLKYQCRTFYTSYIFRNRILVILFGLLVMGSITLTIFMILDGYVFSCTYDLTSDHEYYICVVGGTPVIIFCTIVYTMVLLAQLIVIFYGNKKALKVEKNFEGRNVFHFSSIMLIAIFCKDSQSPHSGTLSELIEFFFSDKFKNAVDENVSETGIREDSDLRELSLTLCNDSLENLTLSEREYDSKSFRNTILIRRFKLMECIPLAELLVKHELWQTFVFLLDNLEDLNTCSQKDRKDFSSLLISFDSLASQDEDVTKLSDEFYETKSRGVSRSSHSLLYYAINVRKGENFDVACFLLTCCKPTNPYVHHFPEGKYEPCETATQYVASRWDIYKNCTDYVKLISAIKQCKEDTEEEPLYKCQNILNKTLEAYKENVQDEHVRDRICNMLAGRRFRVWDDIASDFLDTAKDNKHHEIEFSLLSAYFPGSPFRYLERRESIPSDDCMKNIFNSSDYELEDCKYLAERLTKSCSWDMLVGLLNNAKTTCDEMTPERRESLRKLFKDLKIDLEALHESLGTNIVLQALQPIHNRRHDNNHFAAAEFILLMSKPQILFFIKGDVKNRVPRDFNTSHETEFYRKCKQALVEFELKYLFPEYENETMNEKQVGDILTDVPIRLWNDDVHKFAELAASRRHWGIVVSLLKTHYTEFDGRLKADQYVCIDYADKLWYWIVARQKEHDSDNLIHHIRSFRSEYLRTTEDAVAEIEKNYISWQA